jgi:hypothetical protein
MTASTGAPSCLAHRFLHLAEQLEPLAIAAVPLGFHSLAQQIHVLLEAAARRHCCVYTAHFTGGPLQRR